MILHNKGSSLLMVLLVISLLSVSVMTIWHSTTYTVDIAMQRARYEQHFNAAQALLNYGIACAQENFDRVLLESGKIIIPIDNWIVYQTTSYKGELSFALDNKNIAIQASVFESNNKVCGLQCILKREQGEDDINDTEPRFIVENWQQI